MGRSRPEKKQYWIEKIQQWEASGKSLAAWCREQGECYHVALYHHRRLRASPKAQTTSFVEVPTNSSPSTGISFQFGKITLHIAPNFDADALLTAIRVLMRLSC